MNAGCVKYSIRPISYFSTTEVRNNGEEEKYQEPNSNEKVCLKRPNYRHGEHQTAPIWIRLTGAYVDWLMWPQKFDMASSSAPLDMREI